MLEPFIRPGGIGHMLKIGAQIGRRHAHEVVHPAAQAAFVESRPFAELLAADPRVTAHLDQHATAAVLGPTAYTGLWAEMGPLRRLPRSGYRRRDRPAQRLRNSCKGKLGKSENGSDLAKRTLRPKIAPLALDTFPHIGSEPAGG
jgi:hypothetical protein